MYYSKTNNAFYDDPKYYPIVPSDLIQITDQECKYLLEQQSKGKIIKAGSNGKPIAVTPPSPTLQQIQTQKNIEARKYLSDTDWYIIRFQETGIIIPLEITKQRKLARDSIVE